MRKLLTAAASALLILSFAAGCGKTNGNPAPPDISAPSSENPDGTDQQAALDAFQTLLKTPGQEKEAIAELTKTLTKLSPENADKAVLCFEDYQNDAITAGTPVGSNLVQLISQNAGDPYNEKILNDPAKVTNGDLKNALQALFDKGYKLIVPEGMYQAVVNYDIYKNFEPYVTRDIADYIEIKARESENRAQEDAGLIIPVDDIYLRAVACQAFIGAYPDSEKAGEVKRMYGSYVDTYFYGQNNTPAFDYTSGALNEQFLDSYQKTAAGSLDNPLAKAAANYLQVLGDNGYKLTDAVKTYREQLTKELEGN